MRPRLLYIRNSPAYPGELELCVKPDQFDDLTVYPLKDEQIVLMARILTNYIFERHRRNDGGPGEETT